MSQYQEGTVDVTNGSQTVTGTNTEFTTEVDVNDLFSVDGDNVLYEIASVDSDTQITLAANYAGTTATGVTYSISRDFTTNRSYPLLAPGDLEASAVYSRGMKLVDQDIDQLLGGSVGFSALGLLEQSADPADPADGESVVWMSDGSGAGGDGDVMVKINVGGTVKTITLIDYSTN